jgi:hypothetical protein
MCIFSYVFSTHEASTEKYLCGNVSIKYDDLPVCTLRPPNFINLLTWKYSFYLKVVAGIQLASAQDGLPGNWVHVQVWNLALSKILRCIV